MGVFKISKELHFRRSKLGQKERQSPPAKERNATIWRRRRSEAVVLKERPLEKGSRGSMRGSQGHTAGVAHFRGRQ